jgi:5'-3' exonuclease
MYKYIIFDTVNLGYSVFNSTEGPSETEIRKSTVKLGTKKIYQLFLKSLIEKVEFLKKKYLEEGGEIIFLYDNYTSREEIKQLLIPLKESDRRKNKNADYKSHRKNQRYEFYNTLETFRYWWLIGEKTEHTVRIPNLEADDLVKPCLSFLRRKNKNSKILLVTNDSDWCRYLDEDTHYLPELHKEPVDRQKFFEKWGFDPAEEKIILYKIIQGDQTDNIKMVFPEFNPKLRNFIITKFNSTVDFMYEASTVPELEPFTSLIKERESEIRSAYQLLSSIPVSDLHFVNVYTSGRGSIIMRNQLKKLIFNDIEEKEKFEFGDFVPRYDPKKENVVNENL